MRRLVVAALAVLVAVAIAAAATASSGGDGSYRVRALFANASFIIDGEDVRVAGVVVGQVESIDLTPENTAAVVLKIDDPAFADFRADATCRVRLQSLIGEQFVECVPTQPRGTGTEAPPLRRVTAGAGKGQHLLPVSQTTSPVGPDLLANIQRLPERERFRLILAELGTGLAANGDTLREAVRRADPALQQADRFVATLAGQDRVLARLVERSDAVLAPLARRRAALSGFVDGAGRTAQAAADRGPALEASLRRFPAFLREFGAATSRLGGLARQADPALGSLQARATAINRLVARLGPLSVAATPALESLGDLADRGREAFPAIEPLARDVGTLAKPLRPLATDLGQLSESFQDADGIEALMRFIFFYTGTVNGSDGTSHYIRSVLGVNACADRLATREASCIGTFPSADSASGASASAAAVATTGDPVGRQAAADGMEFLLGNDEEPRP